MIYTANPKSSWSPASWSSRSEPANSSTLSATFSPDRQRSCSPILRKRERGEGENSCQHAHTDLLPLQRDASNCNCKSLRILSADGDRVKKFPKTLRVEGLPQLTK